MNIIIGLIIIIGLLTFVVGASLYVTEFFSMRELESHLHDLGTNVYSTEKKIQNNLRKDNIGKRIQLIGAQVIFTSEYKCHFASRFSFGKSRPVKGEIVWHGENAKINARMPLGLIISLIGLILVFGTMSFISLFGPSRTTSSEMEMVIQSVFPFVLIPGIYFLNFFISKKNALMIIDGIIELVQPKNI